MDGTTGKLFESMAFGECLAKEEYKNFTDTDGSCEIVRNASKGFPEKYLAQDLYLKLAEKMKLPERERLERLKFFSTLDSPLDTVNIDGFFDYYQANGQRVTVLLDLSYKDKVYPDKDIYVVFVDGRQGEDNPDEPGFRGSLPPYWKMINRHSSRIAKYLQAKERGESYGL